MANRPALELVKMVISGDKEARVHLKIEGRVQGVFFRASTVDEAVRLGLKGWVRNAPDGSVEVVAEGPKTHLDQLVTWCRHGPSHAHVHRVQTCWEDHRNEFKDFRVRG